MTKNNSENNNVIWSYIGTFFIMGVNIFLLPLILHILPHKELGLWYVFASVATFIQLVNFGFTPCLMRSIGHVWGGANDILKDGILQTNIETEINYELFNNVIAVTRTLYKRLGLIVLLLAISVGSVYIYTVLDDIELKYACCSWIIYAVGLAINMTFEYWNVILRGIGCVADGQKANIISKIVQVVVSSIGLLLGAGLIALSSAFLLSGIVLRFYLRSKCIDKLDLNKVDLKWHCNNPVLKKNLLCNAKKYGVTVLSTQLVAQAFQMIIASCFGLEISAEYGLTVQLLSFIMTIAVVHYNAIVPEIVICGISNNNERIKKLFCSGLCSFWIISILGIVCLVTLGPMVLNVFSKDNTMLPLGMTCLIAMVYFVENNRSIFTTFISTKNELPFTIPVVVCSIIIVVLSLLSTIAFKSLIVLFIIRLVVEMSYNGWKWMKDVFVGLDLSIYKIFDKAKEYYFKI